MKAYISPLITRSLKASGYSVNDVRNSIDAELGKEAKLIDIKTVQAGREVKSKANGNIIRFTQKDGRKWELPATLPGQTLAFFLACDALPYMGEDDMVTFPVKITNWLDKFPYIASPTDDKK